MYFFDVKKAIDLLDAFGTRAKRNGFPSSRTSVVVTVLEGLVAGLAAAREFQVIHLKLLVICMFRPALLYVPGLIQP